MRFTRRTWPGIAIGSLLLAASPSAALDPEKFVTQYTHQVWRTDEGLPQNSVQAIAQTPDGYLWLGTQEGLVRFDGVRFTVFDQKNEQSLKSADVLALCSGSDGSLWIGTRRGGVVRFHDGVFTAYGHREGLPNDVVKSLYEDSRRRMWVGTEGGLVRFENGRFVPPKVSGSNPADMVLAIAESGEDLWIGTGGGGLRRIRGGEVRTFTKKDGLPSDFVRCLHADRDGTLWIGTRGGGFGRLRSDTFTPIAMQDKSWSTIGSGGIRRDRAGNLWVGTSGGGLLRLQGDRVSALTKKDGLTGEIVMCVFEDREGSLWIGTDGDGLHRLKDGKVTTFSTQEGLSDNMLLPIYEDRRGTLWLGSYGGGLSAYRDGRFTAFTTKGGLSSDAVASLAGDGAGNLWIGTDGGGLNRLHDGQFSHYGTAEGLSNNRVVSLLSDREDNLWIGTFGGGLNLMRDGKFQTFGVREGLSSPGVFALTEDRDGNLWIGTDGGGLNRLRDGRFTKWTKKDGLAHDVVYRIYEDSEGALWIGTFEGLNRFKDGRFTTFTTRTGLFDNKIFQILEDDDQNLWMTCNKGIFRVSKRELNDFADGKIRSITSIAFGKADGMKSSECNGTAQPAGWKTRDGTLWFPTTMGAVRIEPRRLPTNPLPPPVSLEDVVIDKHHYTSSRSLAVPPGGGEIEIHYAALSLLDPERVRFRYRLKNFDSTWVEPGTRRVAFYTNTPPGRYTFEVVACNNDGVWNEKGAALDVYLEPHFYQTYWFFGLCALGVVLTGVGGHAYRVRTLTRRKAELIRLVAEKTQQLEEANAILRQLSSQDGLTGIANRRHFDAELHREWRRGMRSKNPLSLLMLDIDGFKAYNDLYGHQQGDECLKSVASTFQAVVKRPGDTVARYGGEEFAVILAETRLDGAVRIAEALRAAVEALRISHQRSGVSPFVTVSVGVACVFPSESEEPSSVIAFADEALYRAKESGRNRVCSADPDSDSELAVVRSF